MTAVSNHPHQELIDRLTDEVCKKFPQDTAILVANFIKYFYRNVAEEDLKTRSFVDLYGACVSHWHFVSERQKQETKIRVYNPQFAGDGWQSSHTIVEVSTDDMPFLVDSVRMAINKEDIDVHLVIGTNDFQIIRDKKGAIIKLLEPAHKTDDAVAEASIYFEIDKQTSQARLKALEARIASVVDDVRIVIADWSSMINRLEDVMTSLKSNILPKDVTKIFGKMLTCDPQISAECVQFLEWLRQDNFTFLGSRYYRVNNEADGRHFEAIAGTGLGVLRKDGSESGERNLDHFPLTAQEEVLSCNPLVIARTNTKATVHRPVYSHSISFKILNEKLQLIGECRFVGLLTSAAYHTLPISIPIIRQKVEAVLKRAGMVPESHDGKNLMNILETLPRNDLFEAPVEDLYQMAMGVLYMQERPKIRLLMRKDPFGRFYSCLVFVPRERFNSTLRRKIQDLLTKELGGTESTFATRFSESVLARIHFIIQVPKNSPIVPNVEEIEKKIIEIGRTWEDELKNALVEHFGEEKGTHLFHVYGEAFPAGYRESFLPRTSVSDIEHFETLTDVKQLGMSFYRSLEELNQMLRFKLYRKAVPIPLSDVVPMLENMGVKVISERPHKILVKDSSPIWINDFEMLHQSGQELNANELKEIFQDAFAHIWHGACENDGFNKLVLAASLPWREITVLRAYSKYMWQTGFTFSQSYVEQTLVQHANIAKGLVELFACRFNPKFQGNLQKREEEELQKINHIESMLDGVQNIDEDRILRRFLLLIRATVRTNFYKVDKKEKRAFVSFKFDPKKIPELPAPVPKHEVFVYAPWVEGVHLRGADVARGGIRWSDRKEDYRTEVLGLMKAQQVKNAVIVPLGAKGGFFCKTLPLDAPRDEIMQRVIECYRTFIRGLLDITDNIVGNKIAPPDHVVRYDTDDPYLVVAADKGTATFSDLANEISKEFKFWLGDAFASGGSAGYDHKKMAITARGAWESVKRHFRELGLDTQQTDFTVVGVGDMAGDVFGNGMLLSPHIRLIGAFNHRHIFIDPNPDAKISFAERKRLFDLPRSQWSDYNPELISPGGGVFDRTSKAIKLSPEMKAALDIQADVLQPNELIRAILKAPVDLLFNGGIGTFVKSSKERDSDVGDKANDMLRINGRDLRCRVVGEGGNLGFTQLGRVEYALKGGKINTDAIDNSGGVDCSDHEVNIKILLNGIVANSDLTEKQRNLLLIEMTDEVAQLVLKNNREQTGAISIAASQSYENVEMHSRLLNALEKSGSLDRNLEFLPSNEQLLERKADGKFGLTQPEICVLMGYIKTWLKQQLLGSHIMEDPYLSQAIYAEFPKVLRERFEPEMMKHPLKREIIATQLANNTINEMGISFVHRLQDETGASANDIIACYSVAKAIFDTDGIYKAIVDLNYKIDSQVQMAMSRELNRLARRCARWFLRNTKTGFSISDTILQFKPHVAKIADNLPSLLTGPSREALEHTIARLLDSGVPKALAARIAGLPAMYSVLDIVSAAIAEKFPVEQVARIYFAVGARLDIYWFREQIKAHPVNNHWDAMARAAFRDDLDRQQRNMTVNILTMNPDAHDINQSIENWLNQHQRFVDRWTHIVNDLKSSNQCDFVMFAVALRELLDLVQAERTLWS